MTPLETVLSLLRSAQSIAQVEGITMASAVVVDAEGGVQTCSSIPTPTAAAAIGIAFAALILRELPADDRRKYAADLVEEIGEVFAQFKETRYKDDRFADVAVRLEAIGAQAEGAQFPILSVALDLENADSRCEFIADETAANVLVGLAVRSLGQRFGHSHPQETLLGIVKAIQLLQEGDV